jgi:hypothetical protein
MKPEVFLNTTIHSHIGTRLTEGNKFGVELELEGRNVGLQDIAVKGWSRVMDGSLRGEAIEYTTIGSKTADDVKKSVVDLFKKFRDNGVKFNDSIRTSTHVHLNFSDKSVKQVVNFFSLFTMLEEVLQHYSGEDRKGNLFCISTREAEGIVGVLVRCLAEQSLGKFAGDRYKYAACNLSTLFKFGTVEVRTMRGASSPEQVNKWIDILNDMYEYAQNKMDGPADLITDLSHLGAEELMRKIFSPASLAELMGTFPLVQTLHYSLMEGARILQVFAYEYSDAFKAKVEMPKIDVKDANDLLPLKIQGGPNIGSDYCIYLPDGNRWYCRPARGAGKLFWAHGDRLTDYPDCYWDQFRQRFICDDGRRLIPCNWRIHHEIPDEGRMRENPEEEIDEDGWDYIEIDFDEGDED